MPAEFPGISGSSQSQPIGQSSSFGLPSAPARGGSNSIFRAIRKHIFLIVWTIVGFLAIAVAVSHWMTPVYEAKVLLEILPDGSTSGGDLISGAVSSLIGGDALKPEVQTQVQVLRDNAVALDVIKTLDLKDKYPFKYTPGRFRKNARILAEQGLPLERAPATRQRIMGLFQRELDIEPIPNTRLISVSVTNSNPQQATDIANALINSLIKNHLQVRYGTVQQASDWMAGQLGSLKTKVADSQQKLATFEKEAGLFGVSVSGGQAGQGGGGTSSATLSVHSPILDRFATLNAERTSAEAARIAKEAIYRLTLTENPDVVIGLGSSDLGSSVQFAQGAQGDSLSLLQSLRIQDTSLKVQYADSATKYGANNPRLLELQNQLAQLNKQMLEEMKRISQRAKNDYDLAVKNETEINKTFEAERKKAVQVNGDALKAQMLAEEASSNQLLYEELYSRLQQAGVSVGLQGTNIDIVDPALLPAAPKWPNRILNLALGLFFGIVFGVGSSVILENMNDTISTAVEVEGLTGIPVYGSIPRFDSVRSRRSAYEAISRIVTKQDQETDEKVEDQAWTIRAPKSIIAESYRGLRTSLLLSRPAGTLKTVMMTSPAPGDGKSTTSYNLAVALAQGERRVVLVDADLRRPRLHALMNVKATPGLSNVLTSGLDVKSALVQHPLVENLQFLPAGSIPPTPAELLGSQRFTELLAILQKEFDIVLLDCTPDTMVSDAVIVGNHADTILLIARAGITKHRMIQRAVEILQRQCRNAYLALVINAVDMMSADYYYDYGYYGKGTYYENETENN